MQLLIFTQKVDREDDNLGFFHRWIEEFARHVEQVTVICLYEGPHTLPSNVRVLSLGKEKKQSRIRYLWRFYTYIVRERKSYDAVFVHMNQIYVILGGLLWRLSGKRVVLWYAHGTIGRGVRLAERLAHAVVTSTPEGFRLPSRKVHVVGQGVDTELFTPSRNDPRDDALRLIAVGRLSPVKRYELVIEAVRLLRRDGVPATLSIVGGPITDTDQDYARALRTRAASQDLCGTVSFTGPVPQRAVASYFRKSDVCVSVSRTGSLDKTILEAMACGVVVLTSNDAARGILHAFPLSLLSDSEPRTIAAALRALQALSSDEHRKLSETLRATVVENHSLSRLVGRILALL